MLSRRHVVAMMAARLRRESYTVVKMSRLMSKTSATTRVNTSFAKLVTNVTIAVIT